MLNNTKQKNLSKQMTIFHYTSGHGLFGILNSGELHCSNINFLNDPTESLYFTEILKNVLMNSENVKEIYSTLYNDSYQEAIAKPDSSFVVSFSKNEDSLTLWNHYSKGNGYNLGIDVDSIINNNIGDNISIKKIELTYDKNFQAEKLFNFIEEHKGALEQYLALSAKLGNESNEYEQVFLDSQMTGIIEDFNEGLYKLSCGFKHTAYEQEQEVRLLISTRYPFEPKTKYKISERGVFIEYFPLKICLESNLVSVMVHPLHGMLHMEGIRSFLASKNLLSTTSVKVSKIPFRNI